MQGSFLIFIIKEIDIGAKRSSLMNKKQKLAYCLIIIMIISLVPHFSRGASWNRINKVITVMEQEVISAEDAPELIIDLVDELEVGDLFYLQLSGAKWLDEPYISTLIGAASEASLETKLIGSMLQIKIQGARLERGTSIRIPMALQMVDEISFVEIISNNTAVTSGRYHVATAMNYRGKVSTHQIPTAVKEGEMADLWIEEPFSKAFSKAMNQGKQGVIELQLSHQGFSFDIYTSTPQLIGIKGFEGINSGADAIKQIDGQTLEILLPDISQAKYTGGFILSGIKIIEENHNNFQGKLAVKAKGDLIQEATVEVLEIMDYTVDLEVKSKKVYSGTKQEVQFALVEKVADSLVKERVTYFEFGNGVSLETNTQGKVEVTMNGEVMVCEPIKKGNLVIGFKVQQLPKEASRYDFQVTLMIPHGTQGNIELVVEGRSLIKTLTAKVLAVNTPFQVEVEPFEVRIGFKDQVGGKIEIRELAPGEIAQGKTIILQFEESGMKFTKLPQITVTEGDIRLGTPVWQSNRLEIPIVRRSNEASIITISHFTLTADQTIASGNYKLQIGGTGFSELATEQSLDAIWQGDFLKVAEENEVIPTPPPVMVTPIKFTIGKSHYTIGSTNKSMDATPYISNGRTMLPIKYVADAIGIGGECILWHPTTKTVTIKANQTITLQLGSKIMKIDGKTYTMSAPPEAKNGRTFVPVAEITRALAIQTVWESSTKSVIFYIYD